MREDQIYLPMHYTLRAFCDILHGQDTRKRGSMHLSDDPLTTSRGIWYNSAMSSHANRSVLIQKRAALKATSVVWHGRQTGVRSRFYSRERYTTERAICRGVRGAFHPRMKHGGIHALCYVRNGASYAPCAPLLGVIYVRRAEASNSSYK